jgi:hypothetical protein
MLAAWQDQEGGTGHHDMHMGDDLIAVNSNSDGAARQAAQQAAARGGAAGRGAAPAAAAGGADGTAANGRFTVGAAPALWGRSWDFGDAVVVIMVQPTYGGKAYWSSRIFANHNGFWKMEQSYHTTIQASPMMTEVPPKEMWPPAPARGGRGAAPAPEGSN